MKNRITPILIIITTLFFIGCDKIDTPLADPSSGNGGDDTTIARRILMEEFTGHYCTNCPQGADEMARLVGVYGKQIIPISLHAGDQTFNEPHPGSGKYETDFRTPAGNAYAIQFQPFGLPSGMVSRESTGTAIPFSQWEAKIITLKDLAPIAEITINTTYNSGTREVSIDIETEWLLDGGSTDYKLQVYIIEDHIIDWQLNGSTDVANYEHRHVFRGAINTTWGEAITTATTQGSKDNKSYTKILNAGWNEDNCEIVAFIYKQGPDYEVMQANIEHVK